MTAEADKAEDGQAAQTPRPFPSAKSADPATLFQAALMRHRAGKLDDAKRNYLLTLKLDPGHSGAWVNLGVVHRAQGRPEAAVACLKRGIALDPDDGGAWSNLGNALRAAGRLEEALHAQARAVSLAPEEAQLHYNHGIVMKDMGELDAARHAYRRAELLGYTKPDLAWDKALLDLLAGDLDAGFAAYASRFALPENPPRFTQLPEWQGQALGPGECLLIHAEQGFGDSLQFLRYVRAAAEQAVGPIVLELQQPLHRLALPLLDGLDIRLIARDEPPGPVSHQIALMSLPALLGSRDFLGLVPYLTAPAAPRLRRHSGALHVGIAWAGRPTHKNDRNRSLGLAGFLPLLELPGTELFSLQVGPRQGDIATLGLEALVTDLGARVKDFADTAALMQDLDLIITVDTSVAHLAGALGRPVWVLLPFAPDWRWQLSRQDSPWYPTMTLYRQTSPGDWPELMDRVGAGLRALLSAAPARP